MLELELKAVVPDVDSVRHHLATGGADAGYRGVLSDRRYDRRGELAGRDEVLRVRTHEGELGQSVMAWKGPVHLSSEGYKAREELECAVSPGGGDPHAVLVALGYEVVGRIDRYVEYYTIGEGVCRLEWYPAMDVLVEVEGTPAAIEHLIAVTEIPRDYFSPDSLQVFTARYEARTGRPAAVSLDVTPGSPPASPPWPV